MTNRVLAEECSCPCGRATFAIDGRLLTRFICHCQICQSLYKAPYADVTAFWAGSITVKDEGSLEYKRYRAPPALQRGTCRGCGAPVLGYMRLAPFVRLAFVPARNIKSALALPEPVAHIFYQRRQEAANDTLPKFSSYLSSELAVTRLVLKGAFGGDA
jgi:hypothetical protein